MLNYLEFRIILLTIRLRLKKNYKFLIVNEFSTPISCFCIQRKQPHHELNNYILYQLHFQICDNFLNS